MPALDPFATRKPLATHLTLREICDQLEVLGDAAEESGLTELADAIRKCADADGALKRRHLEKMIADMPSMFTVGTPGHRPDYFFYGLGALRHADNPWVTARTRPREK